MKLSELPRGKYAKLDKMRFLGMGKGSAFLIKPDLVMQVTIISSPHYIEFEVEETNRKDFDEVFKTVKYDNTAFSRLCIESCKRLQREKPR